VVNTGVYNYTTAAGAFTSQQGAQTLTFQNAVGTVFVTLADATTKANALASINAATASLGIYAVDDPAANTLSIQSGSDFSLSASVTTTSSVLGGGNSTATIVDPLATASVTGNALAAISLLGTAVQNLGLVQGKVGTGQNLLGYAINLANSQISNFSAAQSRIRDTDMAAEAANLTKASVLQQASIAAMAQANSAPQAVLALLRGQ
jgi:flagellin